jgi:hypothetical protein
VFTQGGAGAQERRYPVLGGRIESLKGCHSGTTGADACSVADIRPRP